MIAATVCFRVDDFESDNTLPAGTYLPVLCVENPECDDDQEQDAFIKLPVNGDMKLVSYYDEEEKIHALVVYNSDTD